MKIKRLSLDPWMTHPMFHDERVPCEPFFGKPGLYMVKIGNLCACWFETPDGKAFEYDLESFDYTLRMLNAFELPPEKKRAYLVAVNAGIATKEQRRTCYDIILAMKSRKIRRQVKLVFMKGKKRCTS